MRTYMCMCMCIRMCMYMRMCKWACACACCMLHVACCSLSQSFLQVRQVDGTSCGLFMNMTLQAIIMRPPTVDPWTVRPDVGMISDGAFLFFLLLIA